jgi:hypothetical protein
MNKACLAVFMLLSAFQLKAQTDTPEQFLALIPKASAIKSYRPALGGDTDPFRVEIQGRLNRMDTALKAMNHRLEGAMKQGGQKMAASMGVPPEVASGKKKLTKEERQAMANQMLQAQLGPGAPSYEQLKAMSPEERRAWATTYGNQMAAQARANPGKIQPPQNLPKAQDIQRLQAIEQETQAMLRKYKERYQAIKLEYSELSKPSGRDYSSSMTANPEDRQRAVQTVAPKLAALMEEQVAEIRANLGKWKEADELLARQNGLDKAPVPGLRAMQMIRACLGDISQSLGF